MPKSKQRKDHKKKVNARNTTNKNLVAKAKKAQTEFLMDLIKKEQEAGKFDNNNPLLDGPII